MLDGVMECKDVLFQIKDKMFMVTLDKINKAADLICKGELIAFPTETVYGLGANALDAKAVARIFALKERPYFDPLIVHIHSQHIVNQLVMDVPPLAQTLMKRFWPGPLTIILRKKPLVPDIVTAGMPTVGLRIPNHPVALALIEKAGVPIAAPSANPFGKLSPTKAEHVAKYFNQQIPMILDGGACQKGLESTIIDLSGFEPTIRRLGALPIEDITACIGPCRDVTANSGGDIMPGTLDKHYAPQTVLILLSAQDPWPKSPSRRGYVVFGVTPDELKDEPHVLNLSKQGDLFEAAAGLFEGLHQMDQMGLERIYVKPFPKHGLGLAIMDRLVKAANTFRA